MNVKKLQVYISEFQDTEPPNRLSTPRSARSYLPITLASIAGRLYPSRRADRIGEFQLL